MTRDEWEQVVRMIQDLGLKVESINPDEATMVVSVPAATAVPTGH